MNKNSSEHKWQNYLSILRSSSKSYKVVTAVGLTINFLISVSILQGIVTHEDHYAAISLRAALDTALFFITTHLFVRTYLKVAIVTELLSWQKFGIFLLYLIPVAAFGVAGSFAIGQIEMLHFTDINGMQLTNKDGVLQFNFSKFAFLLLALFNSYILLIIWAIIYLFWHQLLNRKKMQKEMHQAQIQQLTNQLNPHFLFNAFNSIRALIYEDQDKAADTVTQLSELFRTHLQAHLKAKSTLHDEWQVCSRYLAIEAIRLEERLQLQVDIDDALLEQYLPTLTLLTLIENAVKHGISPNSENGKIIVKAIKINDKHWQLSVGNTVNKRSQASGTKTGIKNVKQRMELMFGLQYDWKQTRNDNYFEVKMELPLA